MTKRHKVLMMTIRRALIMIAEAIKLFCDDDTQPAEVHTNQELA